MNRSDDGLRIISLGNDFNSYSCQEWANLGASYPIVDDRSTAIWSLFGNGVVPRNVIIDSNGVVRHNSIGYNETEITSLLDSLLSNQLTIKPQTPSSSYLIANYPNPFNSGTQIEFQLEQNRIIKLAVVDARGKQVKLLSNAYLEAGKHVIRWNGLSDAGVALPSGVYILQLRTQRSVEAKKILIMK